jgi:hypothetical protein
MSARKATNSALVCRAAVLPSKIPLFVSSAAWSEKGTVSVVLESMALQTTRRERQHGIESIEVPEAASACSGVLCRRAQGGFDTLEYPKARSRIRRRPHARRSGLGSRRTEPHRMERYMASAGLRDQGGIANMRRCFGPRLESHNQSARHLAQSGRCRGRARESRAPRSPRACRRPRLQCWPRYKKRSEHRRALPQSPNRRTRWRGLRPSRPKRGESQHAKPRADVRSMRGWNGGAP